MDFIYTIGVYWMLALLAIGPFQVIASAIRAQQMEDWNSDFGKRLKIYFNLLLSYWIAAAITYIMIQFGFNMKWTFFLFVPLSSTILAVYYWRAIYLYQKDKKEIINL